MTRPRTWDSKKVEQEYVTGQMSLRDLSQRHGLALSNLSRIAKLEDWSGKRYAYRSALDRRGYEVMAAEIASQQGIIREESILVMRATLRKYAERLAAGEVSVTTKDAVEAVKTIAMLMGAPDTGRDADGARTVSKPDADHLRRVVDAARRQLARSELLDGAAPVSESGTRIN